MTYIAGAKNLIDTGDTYFGEIEKLPVSGRDIAVRFISRGKILNSPVLDSKPLDARIEFARWIVDCPNCHSAEFAFEDKLFLCSNCGNSDVNGQVRKVKMPSERKQIEGLLGKRKIINRHWYPGETVEKLQKENDKDLSQ